MDRPIILQKGRTGIANVTRFLELLPVDKAWDVIVRPHRAKRSDQQNAYWWAVVVKTLSEASGLDGDDVHEALCGGHFGWKDRRVPRTPRNPDGIVSVPLRTTTRDEFGHHSTLTKTEFADLIAYAQRYAANYGINIPDPDPEWFMREDTKPEAESQVA